MQSQSWLLARFKPTNFFSLKPAYATSSGGKSLLSPTPFAIKMALLDVALRTLGEAQGKILFPEIRRLQIAMRPPELATVNNTFAKILRPNDSISKVKKEEQAAKLAEAIANQKWPMGSTIAFREYVSFTGEFELAFQGMAVETLTALLCQVNYFGKRGGLVQLQDVPQVCPELNLNDYIHLTNSSDMTQGFPLHGVLQMLDDCGDSMTFEHANIYSGKKITLGKERVLRHVVLPYQLVQSSKSFTLYRRIDV